MQRYANLVVEGKHYNDVEKLWHGCQSDASLMKDVQTAKVKGQIDLRLVQRLADVHARLRNKGPNRRNRAQQPSTAAVANAKKQQKDRHT